MLLNLSALRAVKGLNPAQGVKDQKGGGNCRVLRRREHVTSGNGYISWSRRPSLDQCHCIVMQGKLC